jgi:hypothetical protein
MNDRQENNFGMESLLVKIVEFLAGALRNLVCEFQAEGVAFCSPSWYKPAKREIGDFLWLVIAH